MHRNTRILISSLILAALCLNLILYASQRYAPPRAESLSYSILDCPSHQNQNHLSIIVQFFTGEEDERGSEKHCFCYSCCSQRNSLTTPIPASVLIPKHYSVYRIIATELNYTKDFYTKLLIRSPPST